MSQHPKRSCCIENELYFHDKAHRYQREVEYPPESIKKDIIAFRLHLAILRLRKITEIQRFSKRIKALKQSLHRKSRKVRLPPKYKTLERIHSILKETQSARRKAKHELSIIDLVIENCNPESHAMVYQMWTFRDFYGKIKELNCGTLCHVVYSIIIRRMTLWSDQVLRCIISTESKGHIPPLTALEQCLCFVLAALSAARRKQPNKLRSFLFQFAKLKEHIPFDEMLHFCVLHSTENVFYGVFAYV